MSDTSRKPYDPILVFRILVLQSLYNPGDEQAEHQSRAATGSIEV
jgi:hypothetical protein